MRATETGPHGCVKLVNILSRQEITHTHIHTGKQGDTTIGIYLQVQNFLTTYSDNLEQQTVDGGVLYKSL